MNLTSVKTIKELLLKYDAQPSKIMGQNFLVNRQVLEKIVKTANLKKEDTVLEVGPGIGTLTQELAKNVNRVIAVEKDKKMCQILKEILGYKSGRNRTIVPFLPLFNKVEIINDDILKIENFKLISNFKFQISNYKIVANIPYYLTSPLIRKFLENPPNQNQPEDIILMVQKEVAQRICSRPPSPPTNFDPKNNLPIKGKSMSKLVGGKMSLLAVSVQFYAKAEIISYIKKENFWPKPKVDSAIIRITPYKNSPLVPAKLFFKIVKAGFSQPRKQLVNNLNGLKLLNDVKLTKLQITSWLLENNLKPEQRAETLSINDWIQLVSSL